MVLLQIGYEASPEIMLNADWGGASLRNIHAVLHSASHPDKYPHS